MLPNKKNATKNLFYFGFFPFLAFLWPKNSQNWQKWRKFAKFKPFDKIFRNLVCICFLTNKMLQKTFFAFRPFLPFFNQKTAKKQPKKNLPKSKPFDEIFWNLVCRCFQTTKNAIKKLFLDCGLFWPFFNQKTSQKIKLAKSKPFDEIIWNLVCRCFPTKKMLIFLFPTKKMLQFFIWILAFFGPFLNQKTAKKELKKMAKSKPFDEIFWNLVCRCFPTKKC